MNQKTQRIEARCTAEQKKKLLKNAKKAGLSVTEYIIERTCA